MTFPIHHIIYLIPLAYKLKSKQLRIPLKTKQINVISWNLKNLQIRKATQHYSKFVIVMVIADFKASQKVGKTTNDRPDPLFSPTDDTLYFQLIWWTTNFRKQKVREIINSFVLPIKTTNRTAKQKKMKEKISKQYWIAGETRNGELFAKLVNHFRFWFDSFSLHHFSVRWKAFQGRNRTGYCFPFGGSIININ